MIDGENEDDILELTDAVEEGGEQAAEQDERDGEEVIFAIGDADAEEDRDGDTDLVKDLRRQLREEKQARAATTKVAEAKPVEVGPKPKLADFDYDEDAFEEARDAWDERKRQSEQHQTVEQQEQQKSQRVWNERLTSYAAKRTALARPDIDDVEAIVVDRLDQTRQAIIVSGADDPAKVVYALGKNPSKLNELAAITDPVKFAFAIAKLEGQIKVVTRKRTVAPDKISNGSAPISVQSEDKVADKLLEKAQRTGDMAEYRAHMKKQRQKAA